MGVIKDTSDAQIIDNTAGDITPAVVRSVFDATDTRVEGIATTADSATAAASAAQTTADSAAIAADSAQTKANSVETDFNAFATQTQDDFNAVGSSLTLLGDSVTNLQNDKVSKASYNSRRAVINFTGDELDWVVMTNPLATTNVVCTLYEDSEGDFVVYPGTIAVSISQVRVRDTTTGQPYKIVLISADDIY